MHYLYCDRLRTDGGPIPTRAAAGLSPPSCLQSDPNRDLHHPQTVQCCPRSSSPAQGLSHNTQGRGGEQAHQMRGAFLLPVIQRRARRGSKGPLQRAAREVEAAAATAPRHFSRANLCSLRAGLGTSSTARSTESLVVQLSKQARVERGRPSRWQSWVPSAW